MPRNWSKCTLGEAIVLQRGFDLPLQERELGKIPIVSSSGVSGEHSKARVVAPGVVTGRYGTIGQVFYLEEDFWPLNTTLYVKDFKGNDPRFVSYLLRTIDFRSCSDKSSVPGVNRNDLHRIVVNIPSISDQLAIAHVLGALDDKIELNQRMNETLEAMARAIFKSWFVDFDPVRGKVESRQQFGMDAATAALFPDSLQDSPLGSIPAGWSLGPILDAAKLLSGGTPRTDRKEYWDGNILWASARDVSQCRDAFLWETGRTITERGLHESATQILPSLCTVIVARGATTGRMVLLGRDMAMNQTCYGLASRVGAPFFVHCAIRNEVDSLLHTAHGSVFDTITTSTFAGHRMVLPPTKIVAAFESQVSSIFTRILANTIESFTVRALRDALLPKLISGERRLSRGAAPTEVLA